MLGAESLGLENVILSDHAPITLVSHHEHRHLGGGKISLETSDLRQTCYNSFQFTHQIYSGAILERPRVRGIIHQADHVTVGLGGVEAIGGCEDVRVHHNEVLLLPVYYHTVH